MLCCRKILFVTLCSVGRGMGEDARAAHKAGLLPVHLLNSLWNLQAFKTSLKPHLSPAVNTKMGCHFKRDFRNPISWYYSELPCMAKGAIGWSLLAKSSLLFWYFFLLPFFWSNGRVWAELRFRQDGGWCAKFQARVIFQKGVRYAPNKEHKAYNGQADRTFFMVPGPSLCIQPALLPSHSRLSNQLLH